MQTQEPRIAPAFNDLRHYRQVTNRKAGFWVEPSSKPDFQRPPITELGSGIVFRSQTALTSGHLGRFWAQVSNEFPIAEDHAPVGNEWNLSQEGLPLPRVWLIERTKAGVIQLQVNRFYLNWRRQDSGDAYPGFLGHSERLLMYWREFGEFVRKASDQDLVVENAEVLKVSQIYDGDGWSGFPTVPSLLPVLNFDGIAGDWGMRGFATHFALMDRQDRSVNVEIKSARPAHDKTKLLLQLEVRVPVSGIEATSADIGNLAERLTQGNELANMAFTSITSPEAQRNVWHRRS